MTIGPLNVVIAAGDQVIIDSPGVSLYTGDDAAYFGWSPPSGTLILSSTGRWSFSTCYILTKSYIFFFA
jgi:hypothetical protein